MVQLIVHLEISSYINTLLWCLIYKPLAYVYLTFYSITLCLCRFEWVSSSLTLTSIRFVHMRWTYFEDIVSISKQNRWYYLLRSAIRDDRLSNRAKFYILHQCWFHNLTQSITCQTMQLQYHFAQTQFQSILFMIAIIR